MDQRANSHGLTGAAGVVTVVTIHDLLPIAFGIRVWRAGLMRRTRACAGRA